jgi:beta-glucosidase
MKTVSIEQIDNAVRLILNAKYDLGGLFQDPYKYDVKELKMKFLQPRLEARKNCITIFSIT